MLPFEKKIDILCKVSNNQMIILFLVKKIMIEEFFIMKNEDKNQTLFIPNALIHIIIFDLLKTYFLFELFIQIKV